MIWSTERAALTLAVLEDGHGFTRSDCLGCIIGRLGVEEVIYRDGRQKSDSGFFTRPTYHVCLGFIAFGTRRVVEIQARL